MNHLIFKRWTDQHSLYFVLLASLIFFARISGFDFIWDDFPLIVDNPVLRKPFSFTEIFTTGLWHSSLLNNSSQVYYRPIVSALYAVEFKLFSTNADNYHNVSLFLHLLNTTLLWSLARKFSIKGFGLFLVILLFALHPVQMSPVAFISCQGDLLALCWMLLSLFFWTRNGHWKYAAIAIGALALLSKEIAVLLPLIWISYDLIVRKVSFKKITTYWPVLIWIPYFILRIKILHTPLPSGGLAHAYDSPGSYRFLKFISRILFPIPLPPEHQISFIPILKNIIYHLSFVLLISTLFFKFLRDNISKWFCFWFVLLLLPICDWTGMNLRFSDQLLYAAIAPVSLLFGFWLQHASIRLKILTSIWMGAMMLLSQRELPLWKNSVTLWGNALHFNKEDQTANINYAYGLLNMGQGSQACDHFYQTLVLTLKHPNTESQQILTYNLGKCFENERPDVAEKYYRAAIDISKGQHWASRHNLALIYLKTGKMDEAEVMANELTEQFPSIYFSWKLKGTVLIHKNQLEQARTALHKALELNPEDPEILDMLSRI